MSTARYLSQLPPAEEIQRELAAKEKEANALRALLKVVRRHQRAQEAGRELRNRQRGVAHHA